MRYADLGAAAERLLAAGRAAGDRVHAAEGFFFITSSLWLGPEPLSGALAETERLRAIAEGPLEAVAVRNRDALTHLASGEFDAARAVLREVRDSYAEFGMARLAHGVAFGEAFVEFAAGNPVGAERRLREACEVLRSSGETGFLSSAVGQLGEALFRQGRFKEAEEASRESESLTQPGDVMSETVWRTVRAQVLAQRGEYDEALRLVREAVDWVERTDSTDQIASVYVCLARVLRQAGRRDEALAALEHALELYEEKGYRPLVEQTRAALVELRDEERETV
jgi:tetratricopeptide (TPR) repeat protein